MNILAAYTPESWFEIIGLFLVAFLLPVGALYWFVARRFYAKTARKVGFSRIKYLIWILVIGTLFVSMSINSSSALEAENLSYAAWFFSLYPLSRRIQNIGFSRWWTLLALVPILNIWLNLIALFCPALERKRKNESNESAAPKSYWKVAREGKEQKEMDLASIKLGFLNKSLSENDVYWDDKIEDWVPLYCHPRIEKKNKS